MIHDVVLFQSIAFWGLLATLLTGLMAPFGKWAKTSNAHWLPIALGAASLVGGLLSNKSKKDAEYKAANDAYKRQQQYAQMLSPEALKAKFAGTDIGNWLTSTETPVNRSSSTSSTYTKSNPFITGEYQGVHGLAKGLVENRLKSGSSLPEGFQSSGLRSINRAFSNPGAAAEGLGVKSGSFSPGVGASAMAQDSERRGKIADFMTSVPMMERQQQTEDIGLANAMTEAFGKGTETRSTTNSSGESYTTGQLPPGQEFLLNAYLQSQAAKFGGAGAPVKEGLMGSVGSGISSAAQMFGMLYGSGAFDKGGAGGFQMPGMTPNTGANFGQNNPLNFKLGR